MSTPPNIRSRGRLPAAPSAALLLLAVLILPAACDGDGVAPRPPLDVPPTVTVTPAQGAPGAPLTLESEALDFAGPLAVRIGGQRVPLLRSDSGPARSMVPILAAGEAGDAPPSDPVVVEIIAGADSIVARSEAALTILPVPAAPGATDTLVTLLGGLASASGELRAGLPPASAAAAVSGVVSAALDSVLWGASEHSLATALEAIAAADPATRQLMNGVLASSGVLESTRDLLATLEGLGPALEASLQDLRAGPRADGVIDDVDLARQLQTYSVLKLVGETVIGETSTEYGNSVGLVAGSLVGISVPLAGLVGSILSVVDFAVNRVGLGVYPAELTRFELVLEDTVLNPGDTTTARIDIMAVNDPPETSLQELIDLVLASAGLADGVGQASVVNSAREYFQALYEFFLGQVRNGINQIADEYPSIDPGFAVVPALEWTTVADDPRLYELVSGDPETVRPLDDAVNWSAGESAQGSATVFARVATGPDAILIDPPPGFPYTGGAFGEEVRSTETRTVTVMSELVIEVDFPATLSDDDLATLEVRAGHVDADGAPVWEPGIAIEILTDGGSVEQATGATDQDGQFITLAQLDPGSEEIIITVTARDSVGQEAVRTVEAGSGGSGVRGRSDLDEYRVFAYASLEPVDGQPIPGTLAYLHLDSASAFSEDTIHTYSTTYVGDTIRFENRADADGHWTLTYEEDGSLAELTASQSLSVTASWELLPGGTVSSSTTAEGWIEMRMRFDVVDGPAVVDVVTAGAGEYVVWIPGEGNAADGEHQYVLPAGEYQLVISVSGEVIASGSGSSASEDISSEVQVTVRFSRP